MFKTLLCIGLLFAMGMCVAEGWASAPPQMPPQPTPQAALPEKSIDQIRREKREAFMRKQCCCNPFVENAFFSNYTCPNPWSITMPL